MLCGELLKRQGHQVLSCGIFYGKRGRKMEREQYDLPVLFTENEREKYVSWALKKEKVLLPMAVLAGLVDVLVLLAAVCYLWNTRTENAYFSIWMSRWGAVVMKAFGVLALVLTGLVLKPLDVILDHIYKKPEEPKMVTLLPAEEGIHYTVCRQGKKLDGGLLAWADWDRAVLPDTNEVVLNQRKYKIGANTIETIYPADKQKRWMDRPEEKFRNSTDLKKIDRNLKSFLASLEEKKKESEWIGSGPKEE